jgi:hypothetical protein
MLQGPHALGQTDDVSALDRFAQRQARDEYCTGLPIESAAPTTEQVDCWGEEFAARILSLHGADPVADARRMAGAGDFRLIQITDAWGGPWLPGVLCLLPATRETLHGDIFFIDVNYGPGDTVYRRVQLDYSTEFNRTVVTHPSHPLGDVCRVRTPADGTIRDVRHLSFSEWRPADRAGRDVGTLAAAARLGDLNRVRELLDDRANPDESDPWAVTPLDWAVLRGDADVARALLTHGADPNRACRRCATPLNLAVAGGSQEALALLIDAGAELDADSPALQRHSPDDALPGGGADLGGDGAGTT